MPTHQFNIVQADTNVTGCTVNCSLDVFSQNISLIYNCVENLGGTMLNQNTAVVPSHEAVGKLFQELHKLTIPIKRSKKR